MKIKFKSFGPVYVKLNQEGKLEFGESLEKISQAAPEISSPAVSMLYSLASCIALSLQIVAQNKKTTLQPFLLKAASKKAADLPSRFGVFTVSVSDDLVEDRVLAEQLLEKAKSICTVSNTLNAEVNLALADRTCFE